MGQPSWVGKRVSVIGAGRTGQAAARFLTGRGARVFLSDQGELPETLKRNLRSWGVRHEEGGHSRAALDADLIVPSPGVPSHAPMLVEARRRGVPVMGELELAYRFCPSENIIAVTGTVGKTTTIRLIAELLGAHGFEITVAGNVGRPFISEIDRIRRGTVVVLEASSFQLEQVSHFRPHIGVLTRFAPHHLDRHGSIRTYLEAKWRLFARQRENDFAVVQADIELPRTVRSRVHRFSKRDLRSLPERIPAHQRENLAGAWAAARRCDPAVTLAPLDLDRALNLPHRLEYVARAEGMRFYNDSKATSPVATVAALEAFSEPLVLILAGQAAGEAPQDLMRAICTNAARIRSVILMGGARAYGARLLRRAGCPRVRSAPGFDEAIAQALEAGGRICLFSPGAPSFDQFSGYEERGERFKDAVLDFVLGRDRVARHAATSVAPTRVTPGSDREAVPS